MRRLEIARHLTRINPHCVEKVSKISLYRTKCFANTTRRTWTPQRRLLIKKIARQVLRIKSWIYESDRNLYHGRRAVPLQTFTTRHSNRKLFIVMALSTTFTQCAPKTTKCGKIMQNKGHFAIRGHLRSPILAPIESSYTTSYQWLIQTFLLSCTVCEIWPLKCQYLAVPLAFKPPRRKGSPGTVSVKFLVNVNGWSRYSMAKKHCRKFQPAE